MCSSETLTPTNYSMLHHKPENRELNFHGSENVTSHIFVGSYTDVGWSCILSSTNYNVYRLVGTCLCAMHARCNLLELCITNESVMSFT